MIAIPQIFVALVVGIGCYLLAVAMTVYDGILSMIFQPIMGAIFTGAAIIGLLILGLPIRLVKRINIWWKAHWWISLLLGCVALAMMCASWIPRMRVKVLNPETQIQIDSFHPALALGGWLLALFAVLHFYPPLPWSKQKNQRTMVSPQK